MEETMVVQSVTIRATVLNTESHREELWEMNRSPNGMVAIERRDIPQNEGEKSSLITRYHDLVIGKDEFDPNFLKGFILGVSKAAAR